MRNGIDPPEHALNCYEKDFPEKAKAFLSKGKSYAALAGYLDVCQETVMRWRKRYPEFDYACEVGRAKGQAYWEEQSDDNMLNKDYSSVRYIFKMKSQYKLRDGNEADQQPVAPPEENADKKEIMDRAMEQLREKGIL